MKPILTSFFVIAGMSCGIAAPSPAQNEMAMASENEVEAPLPKPSIASLTTHLQMQDGQIERLDRLYDAYAIVRDHDCDL